MRYSNIAGRSAASLGATAALLGFAACVTPAVADPLEAGIWYDDTGKGAVKIEICTPTTLCGKIYWLKNPLNDKGGPKTDAYNPEPTMRKRPICGLPVLGDLEQMSQGGFDNGWVYDPKEGKSYSVALDLLARDKLKVTGYKGMRFLGKSFIWTRAPDDLPACDTNAAAAPGASGGTVASSGHKAKAAAAKLGGPGVKSASKKTKKTERAAIQPRPVASE
jgi:uncharacterized protein (DUF2147 family)